MSWCEMPMAECPHCEKEFQVDDYYDVNIDTELQCPNCEKFVYVHDQEIIMRVNLEKEPHKDSW